MALARCSRSSFSSLRSKWDGGKNTAACGPRHAAFICQASSTRCALTASPFRRRPYRRPFAGNKGQHREQLRMIANTPRSEPVVRRDGRHRLHGDRRRPPESHQWDLAISAVPVVAGRALERLDLEHEPVDRRRPAPGRRRRSAWPGWCGPATGRRGPSTTPSGATGRRPSPILADHPLPPDGGRGEAAADHGRHARRHGQRPCRRCRRAA